MTYFTRGATLGDFVEVARRAGLDPFRLAQAVGLSPAHLADPELSVPGEAFAQLLELAAARGGGEDFGLRVAERWRVATLGLVGQVVRTQLTARQALEALANYIWVQNETLSILVDDGPEVVVVRLGPLSGGRGRGRQTTEFLLGCLTIILRDLFGPAWTPLETHLGHAAPQSAATHRRVLGRGLRFGSDFDGVVCDAANLAAPPPTADPDLARRLEREVQAQAARQGRRLADEVSGLIAAFLPGGDCTADRIAGQLGVDRRTVHRRLAAEGTSFSILLESSRRSLAAAHLDHGRRRLEAVADLLGFSSLSAFSRWHRQAFSETASRRRARSVGLATDGGHPG